MRPTTSPTWPRPPSGRVTWVTVAILLVLGGGTYLGWAWVPLYIRHFQAEQVVRDFMNRAVKNRHDEKLVRDMCDKLETLGTVERRGEDGTLEEVPAVEVSPADVSWERDTEADPPMLHVAFEYTAVVSYPFVEQQDEKVFEVELSQDIQIPVWK